MKLYYDVDSLDNLDPRVVDRWYRLLRGWLKLWFRPEVRGLERIPEGAGLFVGNHNGGFVTPDSFVFASAIWERSGMTHVPYGLGHEWVVKMPPLNQLLCPIGAVRASHQNAMRVFARGRKVLVYPGGDLESMCPWRHRDRIVFGGRDGYARLAIRAGVPIIPIVAAGAHETFLVIDDMRWLARGLRLDKLFRLKVLPLTLSLPWGLTLGVVPTYWPMPTKILMEIGKPISFERSGDAAADDATYVRACADRVEIAMQATLTRLARERKQRHRRS